MWVEINAMARKDHRKYLNTKNPCRNDLNFLFYHGLFFYPWKEMSLLCGNIEEYFYLKLFQSDWVDIRF
jgi:hypothetical protein